MPRDRTVRQAVVLASCGFLLVLPTHVPIMSAHCFANTKVGGAVTLYGDTILHTTDGEQHRTRSFSAGS